MGKTKCCLKHEKKDKHCKGCPLISLEDLVKGDAKKKEKKKDKKKKDKKK